MQNDDLISRAESINELKKMVEYHSVHDVFRGELLHYTGVKAMLECLPAVSAVPVLHRRWLEKQPTCASAHKSRMSVCSECGATGRKSWDYCPYCGAKMDNLLSTCGPDYCEIGGDTK